MGEAEPVDTDWYVGAFNALYPVIYAHRSVAAAAPEAAFAIKHLNITPTDQVLDLCCGNGRHMVHLLAVSPHVVGLDYSQDLLRIASKQVPDAGKLLRGDMRSIPFVNTFSVLTNFFTSFGYFTEEQENRAVLQGIVRALKPAGRFMMDYLNPDHVQRTLVPQSLREQDGYTIEETRWIDGTTQRVNKKTLVTRDGVPIHESGESVQLFHQDELVQMLESVGLSVDAAYGNYGGEAVAAEEPRMVLIGHKG